MPKRKSDDEKFWGHVDKTETCWLWKGSVLSNGYGLYHASHGKAVGAHRISFQRFVGPIPKGMFVLHRCDVRNCVNPEHLFLGTHRDNMADCAAKGRISKGERHRLERHNYQHLTAFHRGESNPNAKLTWAIVRAIRERSEIPPSRLVDIYGVSERRIRKILQGVIWKEAGDG